MQDTDGNGTISFDELREGLAEVTDTMRTPLDPQVQPCHGLPLGTVCSTCARAFTRCTLYCWQLQSAVCTLCAAR